MTLSVLVVDDYVIVRDGFVALMEDFFSPKILHAVSTSREVLDQCRTNKYDLIVLDILLNGESGIDILPEIFSMNPEAKVIAVSASIDFRNILAAFKNGASCYLSKFATDEEFKLAIKFAMEDKKFMCSDSIASVMNSVNSSAYAEFGLLDELSHREVEIATMISNGQKSKDIATVLDISVNTVNKHRNNILKKLKINSSKQLRAIMKRKLN